jgi:hypothetical protein
MNDFNPAFVGLMGKEDIGPVNGKPAGLTAERMELFRQFALEIRFPPNPHRKVDDTLPCGPRATDPLCEVQPHGSLYPGNPTQGEIIFNTFATDAGRPCVTCHKHPFGSAGGKLGGVDPEEPTSMDAAALFNGLNDLSVHSDLKIAHLRNMHEKFGPVWAPPGSASMPETATGFGFTHDGSIPDLFRFLSLNVFTLSAANQAQQVRDVASFLFHFPTGVKPAVGRQVTMPAAGSPGPAGDEALLATLLTLGDLADPNRHCELVASTIAGGRPRRYHLSGGAWVTDVAGETPVSTAALRADAQAPITFTCTPLGSGPRLGGNRDDDARLDGQDCASDDAETWSPAGDVTGLRLAKSPSTDITWDDQAPAAGPSMRYDVAGGGLSDLRARGLAAATSCVAGDLGVPAHTDIRADPSAGDGYYYLARAVNRCAEGGFGPGRASLDPLACP